MTRTFGPFTFDKRQFTINGMDFRLGGFEGERVGLYNEDKRQYTQFPIPRRMTQDMDKAIASKGTYHYFIRDKCWALQNSVIRLLKEKFKCDTVRLFIWNDDTAMDASCKYPTHFVLTTKFVYFTDHPIKIQEGHGDQTGVHISYWKLTPAKEQTKLDGGMF